MKGRPRFGAAVAVAALALSVFALYFAVYPRRHVGLPLGFDPSYYVWRARYLGSQGIGSGSVAARPGYPVLSALMGSLTGLSQLRLTLVLSLVLVPLMAVAVGALARIGFVDTRAGWAATVAATGVIVGPTHLVGENLANALNIALEVAALVLLLMAAAGGPRARVRLGSAVVLLVASGLSHWVFLPVFVAVLGAAFLVVLRPSLRRWARGEAAWRTPAGLLLVLGAVTTVVMVVLIAVVLRAPFSTVEIAPDDVLFIRKFRTDVARLVVPGILGLIGVGWIPRIRRRAERPGPDGERSTLALRLLSAWTVVMAAGIVFGAATTILPPARFLAHLVTVSGAVTAGVLLAMIGEWTGRRWSAWRGSPRAWSWGALAVGAGVVVTALALLSIPAFLRWYDYPELMSAQTLAEARAAARYVDALPEGQSVVFLIDYNGGKPGVYAPILVERTIQIAVAPPRALDVFVFPGTLEDLLAGRLTPAPDARAERETRGLVQDVARVLPSNPPIVVLRSSGPEQYDDAVAHGARVLGPGGGAAVVRGPDVSSIAPSIASGASTPMEPPPSLWWGLGWAAVILAVLGAVGIGWTRAMTGGEVPAEAFASLVPVVGAAVLVIVGVLAARLGVRLNGPGGIGVMVACAGAGWIVAALTAIGGRSIDGAEGGPPPSLPLR